MQHGPRQITIWTLAFTRVCGKAHGSLTIILLCLVFACAHFALWNRNTGVGVCARAFVLRLSSSFSSTWRFLAPLKYLFQKFRQRVNPYFLIVYVTPYTRAIPGAIAATRTRPKGSPSTISVVEKPSPHSCLASSPLSGLPYASSSKSWRVCSARATAWHGALSP